MLSRCDFIFIGDKQLVERIVVLYESEQIFQRRPVQDGRSTRHTMHSAYGVKKFRRTPQVQCCLLPDRGRHVQSVNRLREYLGQRIVQGHDDGHGCNPGD